MRRYVQPLIYFVLAAAFSAKTWANVTGSDIQNFNPTTNGIDFVTVQSSETLEPGIINFGYFLNYAVNTMPNYVDQTTSSRTDFEDSMLGADINIGVGLKRNWDIGFSAPQVYAQDSKSKNVPSGEVSKTGLIEYRANTKYRFYGDQNGGLAFVGSVNVNRVKNNPFVGENDGPTYNFELAWDTTVKGIAYGVNAGYRKRNPGDQLAGVPVEPFKDQFIASAAMSYLLTKYDMKLIAEIFSGFPVKKPNTTTDRNLSSMELLLGVKKDIRHDIALHVGAGTEVYHGSSSPDWRIYTGINWNFGPVWYHASAQGEPKRLEEDNTEYFASRDIQPVEKFVAGDVLFAFDSSALTPQFENALSQLAAYLTRTNYKTLVVEGHTDSVGPDAYNQGLSERRANSVVKYLIEKAKLDAKKVQGIGYGESRPIADNTNYQGRKKNRRVEFNITR